jgi:FemAB-related protein (PEP-CTERM system-associated)
MFRHRTHYLLAERGPERSLRCCRWLKCAACCSAAPWFHCHLPRTAGLRRPIPAAVAALHAAAVSLAGNLRVQHLELRDRVRREAQWPQQSLYVTFRKPIETDVDANMQAIPRKQRAMVRKGIQRGLSAELDRDACRFFDLYADNVQRHGTPALPRRYFEALLSAFGDDCEIQTVIDKQGNAVSSVLSFYFRDEVLPYYAGDLPAARDLAANDYKYWALMSRACQRGCRLFDFGRSKVDTGPYHFKRNWGFEPQPLHYEYALLARDAVPQNNPANPKYRALIAVWQRLPRSVANALGPAIVRHLG